MADDTRIAEACLLLNYSNQSYKEQVLLHKKLQYNKETNSKIEPNDTKSKPPQAERTSEFPTQLTDNTDYTNQTTKDLTPEDLCITLTTSGNVVRAVDEQYYSSQEKEIAQVLISRQNDSSPPRDPIDDLFAAVNCALPELKTCTNNPGTSSEAPKSFPCLPDHNYCLQSYRSNGLIDNSELVKEKYIPNQHINSITPRNSSISTRAKRKKDHDSIVQTPGSPSKPLKLVAIHLGAGHSHNETESLYLAKKVCEEVMLQLPSSINSEFGAKRKRKSSCLSNVRESNQILNEPTNQQNITNKLSAENAVVQLVQRMEDHQALNCGYGSNLNIKGQVECDASMMYDKTHMWAGVGAISGCRNPILLAKALYDRRTIPRHLGLIQPNFLVGSGAKQWMKEYCPHLSIMDSKMISPKAFSTYQKLKSRYDEANRSSIVKADTDFSLSKLDGSATQPDDKSQVDYCKDTMQQSHHYDPQALSRVSPTKLDHGFYCAKTGGNLKKHVRFAKYVDEFEHLPIDFNREIKVDDFRLDTVGAVAVDSDNNFASAISSGGLLLKFKGRVGQAAVPGAGCWSENSVAITTTGVGEYLTLSLFARKVFEKIQTLRLLFDLGHVEKKSDQSNIISCGIDECFEDLVKSPALTHVPANERLAGLLSVCALNSKDSPNRVDQNDLYLTCAHNTRSMCIGYMTSDDIVGHSIMSRQADESDHSTVVRTLKFSVDSNGRCLTDDKPLDGISSGI